MDIERQEVYQPKESYVRLATACPEVAVGDIATNVQRITELYNRAAQQDVSLVVFPELSLTGYTLGDLVQHDLVLHNAQRGLLELARHTKAINTAMIIGLPMAVGNSLYNCAAMVSHGQIKGIVPKINLPNYKEFYEKRWFQSWQNQNITVQIGDQEVPFGTDMLFGIGQAKVGIEICEDLWVAQPPSEKLAAAGANVIANPSASPEQVAKSAYRRQLVAMHSARLVLGYLYAGCDASESTTDIVMSGHQLLAENGAMLQERKPLSRDTRLSIADIDIDRINNDRRKDGNSLSTFTTPVIDCGIVPRQADLRRFVDAHPFIPAGPEANEQLQAIIDIQAQGLATRLKDIGVRPVVLGLSGGLDSTLALLVAARTAELLNVEPGELVKTLTMPGQASSEDTQSNAVKLATALGIENEVIPIGELSQSQLAALSHDGTTQDVTYENVQARTRTALLLNRANQINGLVLGTGDLSEIALGWCTFNGDHISHYNVNASIPKTLVRHLVNHAAQQPEFSSAKAILADILDTPISPELVKAEGNEISQQTEDIIGPYELHDFFLYNFIRWNERPEKILYLANQAFKDSYQPEEIQKWLQVFLSRFMHSQWKRSVAPDGPKVGSVSLSPRGDWRMPSSMSGAMWKRVVE